MDFMGDGIFVAHNVNFDYGFIAYEYEPLERRFRFPKLCTCAGMRRRYPVINPTGSGDSAKSTESSWTIIIGRSATRALPSTC